MQMGNQNMATQKSLAGMVGRPDTATLNVVWRNIPVFINYRVKNGILPSPFKTA